MAVFLCEVTGEIIGDGEVMRFMRVMWDVGSLGCMGKPWFRIWLGAKTHTCRAESRGFVGKMLLNDAAL